jgi:hypothetical protein
MKIILGGSLTVGHMVLVHAIGVRFPSPEQNIYNNNKQSIKKVRILI